MRTLRVILSTALAFVTLPLMSAPALAAGNATLYLSPSSGSYTSGTEVHVAVRVKPGSDAVNAVQANFSYPANLLKFIKIDAAGSAFDIGAPSKEQNGEVMIARGALKPVSGDALVATVVFNTIAHGTAKLAFASGSALPRASDSHDVLNQRTGATYTITGGPAPAPLKATHNGQPGSATASSSPKPSAGFFTLGSNGNSAAMLLLGVLILALIVAGWLLWRRHQPPQPPSSTPPSPPQT
jgi:hypothetical protein